MPDVDPAIIDKITKLQALADTATFDGEATSAMDAANKLMAKYGIERGDLPVNRPDPTTIVIVKYELSGSYLDPRVIMLSRIGRHNGVYVTWRKVYGEVVVSMVGRQAAIDSTRAIFALLDPQMLRTITRFTKHNIEYYENVRSMRSAVAHGFASGVSHKLSQAVQVVNESQGGSLLPALTSDYDEAKANGPKAKNTGAGRSPNSSGYTAGYRAGQNADLGQARLPGGRLALGA